MSSRGWPPDVESRLAGLLEVLRPGAPHRKDMLLEIKLYFFVCLCIGTKGQMYRIGCYAYILTNRP
jgi:hypothetical protein